jgi:hypothetical protein
MLRNVRDGNVQMESIKEWEPRDAGRTTRRTSGDPGKLATNCRGRYSGTRCIEAILRLAAEPGSSPGNVAAAPGDLELRGKPRRGSWRSRQPLPRRRRRIRSPLRRTVSAVWPTHPTHQNRPSTSRSGRSGWDRQRAGEVFPDCIAGEFVHAVHQLAPVIVAPLSRAVQEHHQRIIRSLWGGRRASRWLQQPIRQSAAVRGVEHFPLEAVAMIDLRIEIKMEGCRYLAQDTKLLSGKPLRGRSHCGSGTAASLASSAQDFLELLPCFHPLFVADKPDASRHEHVHVVPLDAVKAEFFGVFFLDQSGSRPARRRAIGFRRSCLQSSEWHSGIRPPAAFPTGECRCGSPSLTIARMAFCRIYG